MKITLGIRTKEQVKVFWEKTQDEEIQQMFPSSISSLKDSLTLFEASQKEHAKSFGQTILVDGVYIGDIWCYAIDEEDEKTAMLSIVIFDKSYWGQGLATAVIPPFIKEVFKRYKIESMGAFCYASNTRSLGALKRAGFLPVETLLENEIASFYLEYQNEKKES